MRPIRSVSVLMPTWQGTLFLERVLAALAAQEIDLPWDFRAIDSGSTDGTLEVLDRWRERFPAPFTIDAIHQVEFDHGDTRNLLAARSEGDLLVFLTQDAIPSSPEWLKQLVANFDDEQVGAACCRNVPRPDCDVLTRIFSAGDPGYTTERRERRLPAPDIYAEMDPEERRQFWLFNDVASAVRRELWERHPFPRTSFGEDILMARALLEAGYTVVYDSEATVEHSHDYDEAETYKRAFIDGRFNAEWLGRICVLLESDVDVLVGRVMETQEPAIRELGLPAPETRALIVRARVLHAAAFRGLHDGGRTERRLPPTRMREEKALHVLYVVHGFPPETWAGTEIYTYNIAKELQRRGHRATILARVPAEDGDERPDFHVEESEFQDLRILRMTHRLQHQSLRESYHQPRAEAVFRRVLLEERPDVVHFQHLIHTSAGLVHVAKEFGLPTVLTCHDYWAVCPRVQLIRPDGEICSENMGAGCYLCVKDTHMGKIPLLKKLGEQGKGVAEGFAANLLESDHSSWSVKHRAQQFLDLQARPDFVLGAYAAADLRISPSRFLREKLLESGRFDPHAFLFSDNGMRTDHVTALAKQPDPEGRIRFGFVGTLVWYKGGETLVRAMRELAGEAAVMNIYGGFDPEQDEHHAELAELAKSGNVNFKGRFDNAKLSEVYAEIDVLVVPSVWYENSPITIHEAYLTETPVLASDIGGMAEFVRDGVDGLHFKVGDAADLAAKMRRFIDEPDLLQRLSGDWMRIKTIAENAAETEFRYRALACRDRTLELAPRVLLEYSAQDAVLREGSVEEQDSDMLLLRPGGSAAVEYELQAVGAGQYEVAFDVYALSCEPTIAHGGRVFVDGEEVARLGLFTPEGEDEIRELVVPIDLDAEARRLRVDLVFGDGADEAYLRLKRVTVRERPRMALGGTA